MTKRTQKTIATIGIAIAATAAALIVGFGGGAEQEPATPIPPAPAEASPAGKATPSPEHEQTPSISSPVTPDVALELLATVPVEAPRIVDYERGDFGQGWQDVDQNGCDTRNDILDRDLTETTYEPGTHECVVLAGTLDDPYTGAAIDFTRGQGTSSQVQIDHIVPLSWAAQQGALEWGNEAREHFANDPLNLLAVDGPANASKGDSGPADWIPETRTSRCGYAARFITILDTYELTVNSPDRDALEHMLATCTAEGGAS